MLRSGDYILITDESHKRYLQIGEVIDIDYCSYDDYIYSYKVRFIDGVEEYNWRFKDCCRRLILERN